MWKLYHLAVSNSERYVSRFNCICNMKSGFVFMLLPKFQPRLLWHHVSLVSWVHSLQLKNAYGSQINLFRTQILGSLHTLTSSNVIMLFSCGIVCPRHRVHYHARSRGSPSDKLSYCRPFSAYKRLFSISGGYSAISGAGESENPQGPAEACY